MIKQQPLFPYAVLALGEVQVEGDDCRNAFTTGRGSSERALISQGFVIFLTDDFFKVYNYM